MRCPSCHHENPEATKFCGNCGALLNNRCANCGGENPPQFKFCGECGAVLQAGTASTVRHFAEPSVAEHSVPEGERKTVTALFADIKGSMELMEGLDPEEARAIRRGIG